MSAVGVCIDNQFYMWGNDGIATTITDSTMKRAPVALEFFADGTKEVVDVDLDMYGMMVLTSGETPHERCSS